MIKIKTVLFITAISVSYIFSQSSNKSSYILSASEILKIMGESKIVYNIQDTTSQVKEKELTVISSDFYIDNSEKGKSYLKKYDLSEKGKENFNDAENSFTSGNYELAIASYKKVLQTDNNFYKAYTYIGDSYFESGDLKSAEYYFRLSIEKNFIDYQAHWFLADTYYKLGLKDSAVNEILTAHLLNRNHDKIIAKLKDYRDDIGKKWVDWEIKPEGWSYEKDGRIYIMESANWVGYDMAEALWKYEPGFAEKLTGKKYDDNTISYEKEAACIAANIESAIMEKERQVIQEGYFQPMIWYEILSKKAPYVMLLIPHELFDRITEYIRKYH